MNLPTWQVVALILGGMLLSGSAGRCIREGKFEGAGVLIFFAILILGRLITS